MTKSKAITLATLRDSGGNSLHHHRHLAWPDRDKPTAFGPHWWSVCELERGGTFGLDAEVQPEVAELGESTSPVCLECYRQLPGLILTAYGKGLW